MKKVAFLLLYCSFNYLNAQIGIGTKNPNSTLSIEGSFEAGYKEINSSYNLTDKDYYITYNGNEGSIIQLPQIGIDSKSYTGRIYKIKNISTHDIAINTSGTELLRNSTSKGFKSFNLAPGNFVEIVNNSHTSDGVWDISYITAPNPPSTNWQFDNIYDFKATSRQVVSDTNTELKGFNQTITIPANKEAKVIISYSIPVGTSHPAGYYGITMQKKAPNSLTFSDFDAGSRKYSATTQLVGADYSMVTISATVSDVIAASSSEQKISYRLMSYLENNSNNHIYFMFKSSEDPNNYNWGQGYWFLQVFLK